MLHKIIRLIATGEGETLDFKQSISDAGKIAKTMVAFANNKGGTLLVGVRDNGSICGVKDEDDIYMLQTAADMYCSPPIKIQITEHKMDGKIVLEARIPASEGITYYAKDEHKQWLVYTRVADSTLKAGPVMFQVMKKRARAHNEISEYSKVESEILRTLQTENGNSLYDLQGCLNIKRNRIIYSLAKLIHFGLVRISYRQKMEYFYLNA